MGMPGMISGTAGSATRHVFHRRPDDRSAPPRAWRRLASRVSGRPLVQATVSGRAAPSTAAAASLPQR